MKDGPAYYWGLQTAVQSALLKATGNQVLFYTANHDLWEVYGNYRTPVNAFGDQSAAMCAFLICMFSSSMVSIYNGQELGLNQPLDFNNADHSRDINPALGDPTIKALYSKAGQLYQEYRTLFRSGDIEWDSGSTGISIIRSLSNTQQQRLGFFFGD